MVYGEEGGHGRPEDEWQEGKMQGRGGKYSKSVNRIDVRRLDWQSRGARGDKGDTNGQGNGARETDGGRRQKDTVKEGCRVMN